MTFLDWLLIATGPAFLLWRRVFYMACWAAGNVIAARDGREVNEAEAFSIGKQRVLQTAADLVIVRLSKIDWVAIGAGLLVLRHNVDAAAHIVWRGIVRDVRILCTFPILIRRWLRERRLEAMQAMKAVSEWQDRLGRDDGVAGQLVKANIEGLELRKAVLARELSEGVPAHLMREKVSELTHIKSFLGAHYAETAPPPQVQALISPLMPAKFKMMAIAGVAFAALVLGLYVQTKRVWALKDDVREVKSQAAAVVKSRDAYASSLAQRDARIINSTKICLSEIETARQSALKAEQQAARERARRIHEQRKALDGGGAVPVSDILRQLPSGAGGSDAAPGAAADPGSPILPP